MSSSISSTGCKGLCDRLQDQSLCVMNHFMHVTVCVCIPCMYIMQLSSSCCFHQFSCTLSVNPSALSMLLTNPLKPATEIVSLSLVPIPQVTKSTRGIPFFFCIHIIIPKMSLFFVLV